MCNYFNNKIEPKKLEESYNRTYDLEEQNIKTSTFVNAFAHDKMPVIGDDVPDEFVIGSWGISAPWINEDDKKALRPVNARLEDIDTTNYFRNNINNRCVVPINSFYEWRWLDPLGKVKEKNSISVVGQDLFGLGCIYYIDKKGILTFAVCMTAGNELLTYIHNKPKGKDKKPEPRMPVILPVGKENDWLNVKNSVHDFEYPNYEVKLETKIVE